MRGLAWRAAEDQAFFNIDGVAGIMNGLFKPKNELPFLS